MSDIVTINPYTEEPVGEYEYASPKQLENNLSVASSTYLDWSRKSLTQRLEFVKLVAQTLNKNTDKLAALISTEMGKPLAQAVAEVQKSVGLCE